MWWDMIYLNVFDGIKFLIDVMLNGTSNMSFINKQYLHFISNQNNKHKT